jgi:phytoene synthase
MEALFAIDAAMGEVVRSTREPMLGPIRLAWWRERLEELDEGSVAPAEPRLQAAFEVLLPIGIKGRDLAGLERGWLGLFDPFPWDAGIGEAIWFRGRQLFAAASRVLGQTTDDDIEEAGGIYAMVDVARHCSDGRSRQMLVDQARTFARRLSSVRFSSKVRPLSMLTALAVRDCAKGEPFEREGAPRRALVMVRHRVTGRLPAAR